MRDELREKLIEKANAKIAEKSMLERKRFWLALLFVATAVFGFAPAPENSGSKLVGVVQTIFRNTLTLGMSVMFKLNMPEKGVTFMRTLLGATTEIEDGCSHQIIEREDYRFHVIRPESLTDTDAPVIVSIHGGGWMVGAVDGCYKFYSIMAMETNSVVIAPDYRLSPEHVFPAALDDVVDTIEYVYNNANQLGVDHNKIIVTGDSAGGGLALSAALVIERDSNAFIKAILPVYPVTQALTVNTPSYLEKTDFLLSQYHMAAFFSSYLSGNGDLIEAYESDELIKSAVKTIPALASIFALGDLMELAEPSDDTPMLTEGQRVVLDLGVSPLLADVELLSSLPPCKIYVSEHDVLKSDGYLMHARMADWGLEVEIEEWEGAIHGQLNMAAQFGPAEIDPQATSHVTGYFADLRSMIDREDEKDAVEVNHEIPEPEEAYFDDEAE